MLSASPALRGLRPGVLILMLALAIATMLPGCGGGVGGPGPQAGTPASGSGGDPAAIPPPPAPPDLAASYPAVEEHRARSSAAETLAEDGLQGSTLTLQPGWNLLAAPLVNLREVTGLASPLFAFEEGSYRIVSPDQLEPSQSFWVYSAEAGTTSFVGDRVAEAANVATRLRRGWNLVGFASAEPVPFSNVTVTVAGAPHALADVTSRDVTNADGATLFQTVFPYSAGGYRVLDMLGAGAVAVPGEGYWVYCWKDDVVVVHRTPGEISTAMPGPGAGVPPLAEKTVFVTAAQGATIAVGGGAVGIPPGSLEADGDVTVSVYEKARIVPYDTTFVPVGKAMEVRSQHPLGDVQVSFPEDLPGTVAVATSGQGESEYIEPAPSGGTLRASDVAARVGATALRDDLKSFARGIEESLDRSGGYALELYPGDEALWENGQGCQRIAVVLHGINSSPNRMRDLGKGLAEAEVDGGRVYNGGVAYLKYDYTEGARPAARFLHEELWRRGKCRPGVSLDLYGHSFGGIVSKSYLLEYDGGPVEGQEGLTHAIGRRLFTIFTPHLGSPVGSSIQLLKLGVLNKASSEDNPCSWWNNDATIAELEPDNAYVNLLNDSWWTKRDYVAVEAISGTRYPIPEPRPTGPEWQHDEDTEWKYLLPNNEDLPDWILNGFNGVRNDGAVDIYSALNVPAGSPLPFGPKGPMAKYWQVPWAHHSHQQHPYVVGEAVAFAKAGVPCPEGTPPGPVADPGPDPEPPPSEPVTPDPLPEPPPEPPRDDAEFVRWPFAPDSPPEYQPALRETGLGDVFEIVVAARNTGNTTWRAGQGYALWNDVAADGLASMPEHVVVDRDVPPGEVFTTRFLLRAPTTPPASAITATFRMTRDHQQFGPYQDWNVSVAPARVSFLLTAEPGGSQAPETMEPREVGAGSTFSLRVHVKNTGGSTLKPEGGWTLNNDFAADGYRDGRTGLPLPADIVLDRDVLPGQVWSVDYFLRAPGQNGDHVLTLKAYQQGGAAEDYLNFPVRVTGQYSGYEDQYLVGDWKPDGLFGGSNLAVRRGCQVLMDYDFDTSHEREAVFGCGEHNDQYLSGDWDGDGENDIALRRGGVIHMDTGKTFAYGNGNLEDEYLVGDYNGDRKDEIWIRRGCQFLVDTAQDGGSEELSFPFGCGVQNDQFLVGNWDGQGGDDIAVRRGQTIIYSTRPQEQVYGMGPYESEYLAGDWNGDGIDNIAVRRDNIVLMDTNFDSSHDLRQVFGHGTAPEATASAFRTVPPAPGSREPVWRLLAGALGGFLPRLPAVAHLSSALRHATSRFGQPG